jgi:uncharacterized protein (TIGR03437 family)
LAADPQANAATNEQFYVVFVDAIGPTTNTFTQVGPRALPPLGDFLFEHFPAFTDYDASLSPATLIFGSALNFLPNGTFPPADNDSTGLNPSREIQIFATQAHVTAANTFTRLTAKSVSFGFVQPLASSSRRRIAFTGGEELGGGNADTSQEVFYLLQPPDIAESSATLLFFTGASEFPVPASTPVPSPTASPTPTPTPTPTPDSSPTPTPTPTPATMAAGLAPGELSIVRSTVDLAPANTSATGGSETKRSPALPVELNGVSVSVAGAAAGLYFVGNSPQQINFVMPLGLLANTTPANVVINNNGTVIRGLVQIVTAQPDLFFTTTVSGNRATVFNVTNPLNRFPEPANGFSVTSDDGTGTQVPTVLELSLTGIRNQVPGFVIVTIGKTDLLGAVTLVASNPNMPGFDLIRFTLPASLAGAGDVPIIVTISPGSGTFPSRPFDTAPRIKISP